MKLTIGLLSSFANKRPFFVTTPIFYVNAVPHIGHLYTALVADTIQRFEKLIDPNCNVIFSTGTDEHGIKVQQAAAKAKLSLPDYCSNISKEYKDLFDEYNVEYTDFIRTTEERHKQAVRHFWSVIKVHVFDRQNKLSKEDYIYKAKYSGWYSVSDESFVPETHVREDLRNGEQVKVSTESGNCVEWTEEVNYMFRLSAFKPHLKQWLQQDGVVTPAKYQKQLLAMLDEEAYFPDISVSRPSSRVHWAIPVPDDPEQSVYVWLDALVNYLTAAGYPDEQLMKSRGRPWPADVQVLGKDILKFHGVYWPAFLMACGWHPPRRLAVHAHWTVDGAKMAKSAGNAVSPRAAAAAREPLRYLLLREATMHSDANYSATKLVNTVNAELADTLGNLASRSTGAALNPRAERPPLHAHELAAAAARLPAAAALLARVERLPDACREYYGNYQFYRAVDEVMHALHLANSFFEASKPWELRKKAECQRELDVVLHITLETLRICGIILQPIIPEMSDRLLEKLQIPKDSRTWQHCETPSWRIKGAIHESKKIQSGKFVLFQRIYDDKINIKKKASV